MKFKVLKKINNFWSGFIVAFILCFVVTYLAWPKIPLEDEKVVGVRVKLPAVNSPSSIIYPRDGEKVSGAFLVYGAGIAFENQGQLALSDSKGKVLLTAPVYFNAPDVGMTGPFATVLDLSNVVTDSETAVLELFETDAATGKKKVLDYKNLRLK